MSRRPRAHSDQRVRRLSIRLTVYQWEQVDRMARFYRVAPAERLETMIGDHLVRLGLEDLEREVSWRRSASRADLTGVQR